MPRAGSTLLQRLLSRHPSVDTVPESWLFLPILCQGKPGIEKTAYHSTLARLARGEIVSRYPAFPETEVKALRSYFFHLIEPILSGENHLFLEKTPRNALIVDRLMDLFPEAYFIFLWRNPCAIMASMNQVVGQGKWILYNHKIDLGPGWENLVSCSQRSDRRILQLRYEDLVQDTNKQIKKLSDFLSLEIPPVNKEESIPRINGRLGDPTGQLDYKGLSHQSLDKWKTGFGNPLRRHWVRNFLRSKGAGFWKQQGYPLEHLLTELESQPKDYRYLGKDFFRFLYGWFYSRQISRTNVKRFLQRGEASYYLD